MSFRASHWSVHEVRGLRPVEKILLLVLSEYADDRDCAWPSQDVLAEEVEVSLSTLRRALRRLQVLGLIEREDRWVMDERGDTHRATNVYRLRVGALPDWDALPGGGPARGGRGRARGGRDTPIPVRVTGMEEVGTKVPVDNLSDLGLSVGSADTGQSDRYGGATRPYRSKRGGIPVTQVTGISTPNHQENHQPDQTQEVTSAREASGPAGSGRVGGAPPVTPLPSSSSPVPGGVVAGPGAPPGAGEVPGDGGPVAGDGSQRPCEAPGTTAEGPGVPGGGSGAGRRSEGLSAPLGVVPAPVVAEGGLAGLLGACLPPGLLGLDAAGARRVGALLAERLEAGWRPEEIRSLMDQPLPSRPRHLSALVAYRLRANVDPALAPAATVAAAGRGRAAAEEARREASRCRADALAAGPRREADPAFVEALGRVRETMPGASRLEVALEAGRLVGAGGGS